MLKTVAQLVLFAMAFATSACAYRLGAPDRSLPGGYKQISIPIFKNLSMEPGIEVSFTNAMIHEFSRSKTARIVDPIFAEAQLLGEILSVRYRPAGENVGKPLDPSDPNPAQGLPTGTVLASTYYIVIETKVTLRRRSDGTILHEKVYVRERPYSAPAVKQAGINTVNPLYNLSARRQNIDLMANDMMAEAHDRLSENF